MLFGLVAQKCHSGLRTQDQQMYSPTLVAVAFCLSHMVGFAFWGQKSAESVGGKEECWGFSQEQALA